MRLLLIHGLSTNPQSPDPLAETRDFIRATAGEAITVDTIYLDKLILDISNDDFALYDPTTGVNAKNADGIYLRGPKTFLSKTVTYPALAYYVSRYCTHADKPCINSYEAYYPGTKVAQATIFCELNVPFLRTLYGMDKDLLIQEAQKTFGYPYILKTNAGSHGDSNYLIHTEAEARKVLADEPETDFLAQAYCPNEKDYRLLLIGDQYLVIERQGAADSHLNNTSKGATAARTDQALPESIIHEARQLAQRLKLSLAGVDIMPDRTTGKFYFLEVNSQPQVRTGALLSEKQALMRDFFLSLTKQKSDH